MVARTFLPDSGDFRQWKWHFKIFYKLTIAWQSKNKKVLTLLCEITFDSSKFSTVKVKNFYKIGIYNILDLWSDRRRRRYIVWVFFNVLRHRIFYHGLILLINIKQFYLLRTFFNFRSRHHV